MKDKRKKIEGKKGSKKHENKPLNTPEKRVVESEVLTKKKYFINEWPKR